MKLTIAYYLMLLYVTVMVHPLLPIFSDIWSHTFSETSHLSTVHAKFGTHHLEISLTKEAGGNTDKNKNTSKTENYSTDTTLIEQGKTIFNYTINSSFCLQIQPDLYAVFLLKHTPPPKNYC